MLGDIPLWLGAADPMGDPGLMGASKRTCLQLFYVNVQKESKRIQCLVGGIEVDLV
jgi:hypothetical protein